MARLKESAALVGAIEPAVQSTEEPPTVGMSIDTDTSETWLSATDWAEAFDAAATGVPHNEARDLVWDELIAILVDKHDGETEPLELIRSSLRRHEGLREAFARAWPLIEPTDLVADLWTVPAYLRRCAPWLSAEEVRLLQRDHAYRWTDADLPLLDAARQRLGDPGTSRRERTRAEALDVEREQMNRVIDGWHRQTATPTASGWSRACATKIFRPSWSTRRCCRPSPLTCWRDPSRTSSSTRRRS
ncbi:hypothetical protein [Aeromicrobium sp. UC242_57]|uniref:hypothetical protein n=1 Tax=Aeromicrobium sp. UC242_57 TaxID=3374624 RepID=UPI0037AB2870